MMERKERATFSSMRKVFVPSGRWIKSKGSGGICTRSKVKWLGEKLKKHEHVSFRLTPTF